ncbi:MAG: HEXXH motif-containing putative peptide modification protein [Bacteriovoracia bacterium]
MKNVNQMKGGKSHEKQKALVQSRDSQEQTNRRSSRKLLRVSKMFDLGMISSYVEFLREEGVRAILSSRPEISKIDLSKLSLPIVSSCYFSAEDLNRSKQWGELFLRDQKRRKLVTGNDIFRSHESEIYSEKEKIYQEAISLIASTWPEYFKIVKAIQPRLAQTTIDDPFESASDPQTFGQILYRMDSDCPVKWAEILVHELGHHYLNIVITTHDEQEIFDQPWDETRYSAIRDIDRPLIGIYHGAFAQACMLGLALRILRSKKIDRKYDQGAYRILERFTSTFQKDYETICGRGLLRFDEHITDIIHIIRDELLDSKSPSSRVSAR